MNFNYLFIILGMASLVNMAHKAPIYHSVLKWFNIDFKPFTCVMCSTFWYTLGLTAIPYGIDSIFIASIAAITAELIDIQIHKL